jgi:cell division protein FtsI/penicillin-binding protein 2
MPKNRYNHIPLKANKILNLILIAMLIIIIRIWHLAVIQYDKKLEESRKPQKRIVIEPAKRATIRDRFNIPLALNKVHYTAAILYSQIRQIPSVVWEKNSDGKKVKIFKRKEYITRLSNMLADELNLNPDNLEDLIYSKASLYYNIPFVIKENLSECEFYRLRIRENDWLGVQVQIAPKRFYPFGKVAGDILGYMGSINRNEYENVLMEIKSLQSYIHQCEEGMINLDLPKGIQSEIQARRRLQELQGYAYSINDIVGKAGIEGRFEQELRGTQGKSTFYSDARGNYLRELPGTRKPLSGQRLLLTISAELQEYCEQLLAQNERIREARASAVDAAKQALLISRQPWIKGGAILAMDPKTGEIVAMASYPRFDPNDFITQEQNKTDREHQANISRWFESESYIGEIWNQKRPLEREYFDDDKKLFFNEKKEMSWEFYLSRILPKTNAVIKSLSKLDNLENAIALQKSVNALRTLFPETDFHSILNELYQEHDHIACGPSIPLAEKKALAERLHLNQTQVAAIKSQFDPLFLNIPRNYDKILLIDLCSMAVRHDFFNPQLLEKVGKQSLAFYHDACGAKVIIEEEVRNMAKDLFHAINFKNWRKENEKTFLKEKRKQEKISKVYPKPYLDYLDVKEQELFQHFWKKHRFKFINTYLNGIKLQEPQLEPYESHFLTWFNEFLLGAHPAFEGKKAYHILQKALAGLNPKLAERYFYSLRGYSELTRPLIGKYRHLRKNKGHQVEKHLAAAFYPTQGFGYGRSQAYRQSASQGSIFKLVPAYAALKQKYNELPSDAISMKNLNPLEITDHTYTIGKDIYVGYHADGRRLPRAYKGGKLPRSTHSIGKIDLLKALESSSNPYFSLLVGDFLHTPESLVDAAKMFSYGSLTGIELPAEIPGKIPEDLSKNRSGLYAMAIGQHSLVVTPLQTSLMLSAIANGGRILKPKIVKMKVGHLADACSDIQCPPTFKYQHELEFAGIDFPLYLNAEESNKNKNIYSTPTIVKNEIFMPDIIRKMLLEGMRRVVVKTQEESLVSLSRFYRDYPEAISDYLELKDNLVGKTSTAESMENIDLDSENGTNVYKHVWFGGIAFNQDHTQEKYVFRDKFGEPELVVVIYLRFGVYGKEAAPLAAQVVTKWHEIMQKH